MKLTTASKLTPGQLFRVKLETNDGNKWPYYMTSKEHDSEGVMCMNLSNGELELFKNAEEIYVDEENMVLHTNLTELAYRLHSTAVAKGFWPPSDLPRKGDVISSIFPQGRARRNLGEALFLVTSELSEGYEHWRGGGDIFDEKEGLVVELADAVIRLLDLGYGIGADRFIDKLMKKAKFNETRPYMHGDKRS